MMGQLPGGRCEKGKDVFIGQIGRFWPKPPNATIPRVSDERPLGARRPRPARSAARQRDPAQSGNA